jgi:hypothetical protein
LLASRQYSGAYYLAGYAVECALKAVIAKQTRRFEFPDKERVNKSFTHKLDDLLKLAGLENVWLAAIITNPTQLNNWAVIKDWSESSRYRVIPRQEAVDLTGAINDPIDGMLMWLTQYW